jgi:hypothetical protein
MAMSPRLLRPRATGFTPKNIPGLYAWYDASNAQGRTLNTANSPPTVSELTDLSGGGRHLSQATSASQPALTTAGQNGRDCLTYSGTSAGGVALRASSTADWNFLHDGTSLYTVFIVAGTSVASGSGNAITYFSTRAISASTFNTRGVHMWHDFGALAANNSIRATISSSGGLVARRDLSATGSVTRAYEFIGDPANATSASRLQLKNQLGTAGNNTNGTTTAEAGDAVSALTLGNAASGGNFQFLGKICEVIFYNRAAALTSTESVTIISYLTKKWGL